MIDYLKLLEIIKNWSGVEKEYWTAVYFLKEYNFLKDTEIQSCEQGLSCYTGDLITYKMMQVADICKQKILIRNKISEIISNLKNGKK